MARYASFYWCLLVLMAFVAMAGAQVEIHEDAADQGEEKWDPEEFERRLAEMNWGEHEDSYPEGFDMPEMPEDFDEEALRRELEALGIPDFDESMWDHEFDEGDTFEDHWDDMDEMDAEGHEDEF